MAEVTTSNSDVAAKHNIIHKRGDSFWRGWEYYSDPAYSVPIDITDSTFKMDVKSEDRLRLIFSFTIGAGLTIIAPNKLELDLLPAVTKIKAGQYLYDLQKTLSDGKVITVMEGEFVLNNDVTN